MTDAGARCELDGAVSDDTRAVLIGSACYTLCSACYTLWREMLGREPAQLDTEW
jgi:hypothetical protein